MVRVMSLVAVLAGGLPIAVFAASSALDPAGVMASVPAFPLVVVLLFALVTALALVRRDRAARQEASLEDSRTMFMQVASHELRTPVTVLRGYLTMAADGSLGELSPELAEVLGTLNSNANEMSELLDLMLQAAQIDLQDLEFRARVVDLREEVRLGVRRAQERCEGDRRLVLATEVQKVPVHVDPERMQVVIGNLIDNALRHSRDGGEVRCEVSRTATLALFEVSAETVGPVPEAPRIFFSRMGPPIRVEDAGIVSWGVGLYFTRQLLRMHGGDLSIVTTGGRLSSFTISLPLAGPGWRRILRRLMISVPQPARTSAVG